MTSGDIPARRQRRGSAQDSADATQLRADRLPDLRRPHPTGPTPPTAGWSRRCLPGPHVRVVTAGAQPRQIEV